MSCGRSLSSAVTVNLCLLACEASVFLHNVGFRVAVSVVVWVVDLEDSVDFEFAVRLDVPDFGFRLGHFCLKLLFRIVVSQQEEAVAEKSRQRQ